MGTRGWFVLLHRGRYYRVFVQYDCYFSGVGKDLVEVIKNHPGSLEVHRTLLDLGNVANFVLEAPVDADQRSDWDVALKCLPDSGPIDEWFLYSDSEDRTLVDDQTEMLSKGDHCFVEYIYLLDLDANHFYALDAYDCNNPILRWPFDKIPENWAQEAEEGRAFEHPGAFPLPRSIQDPMMASVAQRGYEIQERISFSLKAAVYRATVHQTNQTVFLKIFFDVGKIERRAIFVTHERPMAIAEALVEHPHPNVIQIIEKTMFAGLPSLVLEAYDGDLRCLSTDQKTVEGQRDYVVAVAQAAKGVAHLHKLGVVHHDVKPTNILFRRNGEGAITAVICDFESICVPFVGREDKRWREVVWGPMKQAKERNDARDQDAVDSDFDSDLEDDKRDRHWYERIRDRESRRHALRCREERDPRWEVGWEPSWSTKQYRHPDAKYVSPWILDSFSLAMMLEELETKSDDIASRMAELLKSSTDFGTAVENLERAEGLLPRNTS